MTQAKAKSATNVKDAISLLTEDHKKAKKARLDLGVLGAQMLVRKQELQARSGASAAKKPRAA